MGVVIIWIIIVLAIVLSAKKSSGRQQKRQRTYQSHPAQGSYTQRGNSQPSYRQSQSYRQPGQQMQPQYRQPRQQMQSQSYRQPGQQMQPPRQQMQPRQRPVQQVPPVQSIPKARPVENLNDRLRMTVQPYAAPSSELMQQVSDLMITGYQADLRFERDFIGEGAELLNRYEMLQN